MFYKSQLRGTILRKNTERKLNPTNTDSEWNAILENEAEANQYAAKCLAVCAGVGALAWLFNILGIFIIPAKIMNIGMPFTILFFLLPSLLCKVTKGTPLWVKSFYQAPCPNTVFWPGQYLLH